MFVCDVRHVNVYETAGECGMSSNVYTDHVLITDTLKGKPSDVHLSAELHLTARDRRQCAVHMAEYSDIQ